MFSPTKLLADLTAADCGARPSSGPAVVVRPYPYPYIAAFALNNDVDSMNRAVFEDWHGFVSGTGDTPYGPGLGLEIADSFWVWSGGRSDVLAIHRAWPDETDPPQSPDVPRIVELARAGWLDTLHSFGNWRRTPGDDPDRVGAREEARHALETLDRLGVKPRVFVNHSASPSNIGSIWGNYQKGDDRDHPMYCLDLLKAAGFRYFWIDPCTSMAKFGDHLRFEDHGRLQAAIASYPWSAWLRRHGKVLDDDPPDFPKDEDAVRRLLVGFFNETILPIAAKDGTPILAFKRYRGPYRPTSSTFPLQATARNLDQLERDGGAVIVYQHFGVFSLRGRSETRNEPKRATPPAMDEHTVARWIDIAERRRAGRLFVATTRRLLDWLWLREGMVIQTEETPDRWIVRLQGLHCSVLGDRAVESGDLNGLSLLIPEEAPEVVVTLADGAAVAMRRRPDEAFRGRHVLHRPWDSLEWPR
jgi:hypothetical protein